MALAILCFYFKIAGMQYKNEFDEHAMITNKRIIETKLNECAASLTEESRPSLQNGEVISEPFAYAFKTTDVIAIYTHQKGGENGVWFQLKDGSIWSQQGIKQDGACCTDFE